MESLLHDAQWRARRLTPPAAGSRPRVVIDTDAANEIDDQFAIAWALLARERLRLEAFYAAPFSFAHRHGQTPTLPRELPPFNPPGEGMRRSLDEIRRVMRLCGTRDVPALAGTAGYLPALAGTARYLPALAGVAGYLPAEGLAAPCDAVDDLVARALDPRSQDDPLYVLALGCPTNIAAALLREPRVAEGIVVVWTSGYPSAAPQMNHSFNLEQDLRATRLVLDSGVPLVYLPGFQVGAQLRLSLPELERWVQGRGGPGGIGDYLHALYTHNPLWPLRGWTDDASARPGYSWVIWDLICIAWVLQPDWVPSEIVPTPGLTEDLRWRAEPARHAMREAYAVQRDAIFADLFACLATAGPASVPVDD